MSGYVFGGLDVLAASGVIAACDEGHEGLRTAGVVHLRGGVLGIAAAFGSLAATAVLVSPSALRRSVGRAGRVGRARVRRVARARSVLTADQRRGGCSFARTIASIFASFA